MPNKKIFNLELMVTLSCDMRCQYCFGKPGLAVPDRNEGKMKDAVWKNVISLIDNIKSKEYYKGYTGLNVHFFGGEPTLSLDKIQEVMERYENIDDVVFKMVTNGQHLKELAPVLERYSTKTSNILGEPKFYIQLSYDGNPIHDMKRRDINGNPTSAIVKEHVQYMQENGLPYTMKSAITYDTFKYMYEAYEDYLQVSKGDVRYFPTIDQSDAANKMVEFLSEEKKKEYRLDLETSLLKIAKKEIARARSMRNNRYIPQFNWFDNSKAICSMGDGYITIAADGTIFPCHSTAYGGDRSKIATVFDLDMDEKIIAAFDFFKKIKYDNPTCLSCEADYCLKCPAEAYALSKKDTAEDRYTDYCFNEYRCSLYRMASKIKKAFEHIV